MEEDEKMWQKKFAATCEAMKRKNEISRRLRDRGIVNVYPFDWCPNCHFNGMYFGDDLDYGAFYEVASAKYCPSCNGVYNIVKEKNFITGGADKFLSIMKKKLVKNPLLIESLWKILGGGAPCPSCCGRTYIFHKDLGLIDYYDNYWRVCVNRECTWPGEHREMYESA